jgi:hypothetical protein
MRRDDPAAYVRLVANILPDKLEVAVTHEIKRLEWVIVDPAIEHEAADQVLTQTAAAGRKVRATSSARPLLPMFMPSGRSTVARRSSA